MTLDEGMTRRDFLRGAGASGAVVGASGTAAGKKGGSGAKKKGPIDYGGYLEGVNGWGGRVGVDVDERLDVGNLGLGVGEDVEPFGELLAGEFDQRHGIDRRAEPAERVRHQWHQVLERIADDLLLLFPSTSTGFDVDTEQGKLVWERHKNAPHGLSGTGPVTPGIFLPVGRWAYSAGHKP
jgi:hypothetical protein